MYASTRREPRQPQKSRGTVVHTSESDKYDDKITTSLIQKTILDEARSTVIEPETTFTSVARDVLKEREPTMKKLTKLPLGRQGDDIVHAITTYIEVNGVFTANRVWQMLGQDNQGEWIKAYGGRDKSFSKIKSAINNLCASGRIGIQRISETEFVLTSVTRVAPSDAYQRSVDKYNKANKEKSTQRAEVLVDKHVSKPATKPKVTGTIHVVKDDYRHIGYDLDGVALYLRKDDDEIGHLVFTPSL